MIDRTQLNRVNELYAENRNITAAIQNFDAGMPIESLEIGGVLLPTNDMPFPPTMVDAIKNHLQQRQAAINQELTNLGLTGMTQQPQAAVAQQQRQPRLRPPAPPPPTPPSPRRRV